MNNFIPVVLEEGAYMPNRAHANDAGADIFSPIDVDVPAMDSISIDTGVRMAVPDGHAGFVKSKSGLMVRNDIVTDGTVDEGYTGTWVVHLFNHSTHDYHIKAGDKIAQVVFVQISTPEFRQVAKLDESERGEHGFGSTGR